jgi:RNA polymerase sigma factor (sigma-70 family)
MIKSDKDSLLWYIEELLLSEKDIVVLSDNNGIINLKVNGRSFFLYIKSLTYAGNPYPLNTTRAQLPSRDDFKSIKDSNAIFLFLGYDEENEVFACWEPTKTKARLNEKQYVSFFSRLHLQVIAKEKDFVKASLQNGLKYVLFRLDVLPKFLLTIDDFFPDIISYGLPETPEINQGKIFDLEDDSSIVSFIEELYKNDTNESILSLVSSCINKFGKTYYNMTLRDWQILVSEYIEQKHPSISEDDEIEEKITDLIETENKRFLEDVNNSRQLSNILKSEVLPESSEGFRNYLNKILSYPNFSLEETKELFKRYYDGDKKAFDLLVKSNLKIVVNIACLFRNCGASLEDLIQVGSMGLINAIKFYRNKNGANFNSYIRFGIYAFISDSSLDLPYLLTLPAKIIREHIKYRRLYDEFEQQNDYPPSIDDIDLGEEVGIKRKKILSQLPPDFRDAVCYIDDYDSFEDNSNMPDKGLMEESTQIYIQGLLGKLSKRDGGFLTRYYGIGCQEETLEQIAETHSLTRERVRQIVEKSRRRLQEILGLRKKEKQEKNEKKEGETKIQQSPNKKREKKATDKRLNRNRLELPAFLETVDSQHLYNDNDKEPELRSCILHILQKNPSIIGMTTAEITFQVKKAMKRDIRLESVEYVLREMPNVNCVGGRYKIVGVSISELNQREKVITINKSSQPASQPVSQSTPKSAPPTQPALLKEIPVNPPTSHNYTRSTTLQQLYNWGVLTFRERQRCHYKGLFTIGDVQRKIQKHNLTPDSTRFRKETIDMWFKIIGLLEPETKAESIKEPEITFDEYKNINLEDLYIKYFLKIEDLHQAQKDGVINVAKPVLLLAIIDGVAKGEILNNKIVLNDWLENTYKALMKIYSNQFVYKNITSISMPFWYLETDGFWHLKIQGEKTNKTTPTTNWLKDNVLYASFDKDLWYLLQNEKWRKKLREFIIKYKLQTVETNK